jgi:hypothetical protein
MTILIQSFHDFKDMKKSLLSIWKVMAKQGCMHFYLSINNNITFKEFNIFK